jgi:hypothetical protein
MSARYFLQEIDLIVVGNLDRRGDRLVALSCDHVYLPSPILSLLTKRWACLVGSGIL